MPAGLGVYWIAGNLLSIIQEYFLTKHFNKVLDAEDARKAELEERRRKAEEEQKRIDREERAARIAARQAERKHKSYRVSKQPGGKPPK
jgi:YidC/Oxa1 family membrane protein insertase